MLPICRVLICIFLIAYHLPLKAKFNNPNHLKQLAEKNYNHTNFFEDLELRIESNTQFNSYDYTLRIKPNQFNHHQTKLYAAERKSRLEQVTYFKLKKIIDEWKIINLHKTAQSYRSLIKRKLDLYRNYIKNRPIEKNFNVELEAFKYLSPTPLMYKNKKPSSLNSKKIYSLFQKGGLKNDLQIITSLYEKKMAWTKEIAKTNIVRSIDFEFYNEKISRKQSDDFKFQVAFEIPLNITSKRQSARQEAQKKLFQLEWSKQQDLLRLNQVYLQMENLTNLIHSFQGSQITTDIANTIKKSSGNPKEKLQFLMKIIQAKRQLIGLKHTQFMLYLEYLSLTNRLDSHIEITQSVFK